MDQKSIKLLNRSFFAVFSHFGYEALGSCAFCQEYKKEDDYFYVFKDKENDGTLSAFHPCSMRYLNQIELFLQLSNNIPLDEIFRTEVVSLEEVNFTASISKDDILNFACHLLPFTDYKDTWYSDLNLSNLFSFPFEEAFYTSEPKSILSLPLFLNGKLSDFYDFDDLDFTVRFQNPGLWMSKYITSNSMVCLSFNPHTVFKYFLDVMPTHYLIICSSPTLNTQTFSEIFGSFKKNNISHIEILCSFNSKELFYVTRFLCWWINFHSEFNFSISGTMDSTTISCNYPNEKSKNQFFLEFIAECSTSFRDYFSISALDDQSSLKHELVTPYNFSNSFSTILSKKAFDITFLSKPEAFLILCEKLSQLFDFMSPLTFTCLDSPAHHFAIDINLPGLDD